jgi:hypothetical protein
VISLSTTTALGGNLQCHQSVDPGGEIGQPCKGRGLEPGSRPRRDVLLLCYRFDMAIRKKRSISMPPDLDAEIAAAAADAGLSYSAWLADAARKEFTVRAGLAAVSQFEQDHGPFTPDEMADADEWASRAIQRSGHSGTSTGRRSA